MKRLFLIMFSAVALLVILAALSARPAQAAVPGETSLTAAQQVAAVSLTRSRRHGYSRGYGHGRYTYRYSPRYYQHRYSSPYVYRYSPYSYGYRSLNRYPYTWSYRSLNRYPLYGHGGKRIIIIR